MSFASRRAVALEIIAARAADLGTSPETLANEAASEMAARFVLVSQYADAGRGVQHLVSSGAEVREVLAAAETERWDGWLPVEVWDLETGRVCPIVISYRINDRGFRPPH